MPKQVAKATSGLMSRYGDKIRRGVEIHRTDDMMSEGGLPAGIDNGIAMLTDCRFDQVKEGKQNAGEWYFYASGVIMSPVEHNGQRVKGQRTFIMEPLYETPGRTRESTEDHVGQILKYLHWFGIPKSEIESVQDESCLELFAAAVAPDPDNPDAKPPVYVKFRTWKGPKQIIVQKVGRWYCQGENGRGQIKGPYPTEQVAKEANPFAGQDPLTQQTWEGSADYIQEEVSGVVETSPSPIAPKPSKNGPAPIPARSRVAEKEEPAKEFSEMNDLKSLADRADNGDEEAMDMLTTLAVKAGVSQSDIDGAENWQAVAGWASSEKDEQVVEGEDKPDELKFIPSVGEVYKYKAPKLPKPVECEVVSVDPEKEVVNIKRLDGSKAAYKGVKWTALEQVV